MLRRHPETHARGQALDPSVRARLEPRLGHDFSHVRIHTDRSAERAARALRADAFTTGRDMAFAAGLYEPHTSRGVRLIVHELAHLVQQSRGGGAPGAGHEREADAAANGRTAPIVRSAAFGSVQLAASDPSASTVAPAVRRRVMIDSDVLPGLSASAGKSSPSSRRDDVLNAKWPVRCAPATEGRRSVR